MHTRYLATQAGTYATFGNEVLVIMYDLRWMLVFMVVLIGVDFWWGKSESRMRYKETNDPQYKFRFSRAGRRSLNKFVDYITYLLVGAVVGLAILEPLGVANHIITAAFGLGFGCLFDISSIVGHVFAVHHISVTTQDVVKFLSRFVINLLKRKNNDAGIALEDTLNGKEDDIC